MTLRSEAVMYVLSQSGRALVMLGEAASDWAIRGFKEPGELLLACRNAPPLLVVVEIGQTQAMWAEKLEPMLLLSSPPRRLFLVEPGALDDVMDSTFRQHEDHLILWPCTREELSAGLTYMLTPPPPRGAGTGFWRQ
jgi:hypothetical protein